MFNKVKIFILLISVLWVYSLRAQVSCEDAMIEANSMYEDGKFQDCINRLETCAHSSGVYGKNMTDIYRLLALAYMNLNNNEQTEKYVEKLLKSKPDYLMYPNVDPLNFTKLLNTYKVEPKLLLGFLVGPNINSVILKKSYSAFYAEQEYNRAVGLQMGVRVMLQLKKQFNISLDLLNTKAEIRHRVYNTTDWITNYTEKETFAGFQLRLQKEHSFSKTSAAHAGIGFGINYLYSSNVYILSEHSLNNAHQFATQNPIQMRNRVQPNINGLLGVRKNLPKGAMQVEIGYLLYLRNTVKANSRMSDQDFIFNNQYVNDDIRLQLGTLNVSYQFPLIWNVSHNK